MQADNIFSYIKLTYVEICNLQHRPVDQVIKPEHIPIVLEVEPAPLPKGTSENAPPIANLYTLAFPGSAYMKLKIKVLESTTSISPAQIENQGPIRVNVEDFSWGIYESGGGHRAYFKATKITPVQGAPSANTKS